MFKNIFFSHCIILNIHARLTRPGINVGNEISRAGNRAFACMQSITLFLIPKQFLVNKARFGGVEWVKLHFASKIPLKKDIYNNLGINAGYLLFSNAWCWTFFIF